MGTGVLACLSGVHDNDAANRGAPSNGRDVRKHSGHGGVSG